MENELIFNKKNEKLSKNAKKSLRKKISFFFLKNTSWGHGNKTAFFQKKRIFIMLKSSFLTQKTPFT
jgi:hypothetical protein